MFSNIAEILKSFTPAQRITALLILVFTITLISLGPKMIDANTNTCAELETRVKSQEVQITELTERVQQLNTELIQGQQQCTDNLIQKQQEIMGLINGMIAETQQQAKNCNKSKTYHPTVIEEPEDPNAPRVSMMMAQPEPQNTNESESYEKMLTKLKQLKKQVSKTIDKQ